MVASLLVSVLALGFKLNELPLIVQMNQRRNELKANLILLQRQLELEDLVIWLDQTALDTAHRQEWIAAMESALASGRLSHSNMENDTIEKGLGMFAAFEASSLPAAQQNLSGSILRMETKLDAASGRMLGLVEAIIGTSPREIVAYMHHLDSRHIRSNMNPAMDVCLKVLEQNNDHHTTTFIRKKSPIAGTGVCDRTFVNACISKRLQEVPLSYVVVSLPIQGHHGVSQEDEAGAVRAEAYRCVRLTELAPMRSRIEYVCASIFHGWIPQILVNITIPSQMRVPHSMQLYFQHLRPPSDCSDEDGRTVGHLLTSLVQLKPNDLAHAIRSFVNRTAMLRESGWPHIGSMLVGVMGTFYFSVSGLHPGGYPARASPVPTHEDPSLGTEAQATLIGSLLASKVRSSHTPAAACHKSIRSNAVLAMMKERHNWFVPLMEVLLVLPMERRRSTASGKARASIADVAHRLGTLTPRSSVFSTRASTQIVPDDLADVADFDSLVQIAARTHACTHARTHAQTSTRVPRLFSPIHTRLRAHKRLS